MVLPNELTKGVAPIRDIEDPNKRAKVRCEAKGGKWDGTKCIMPQSTRDNEDKGTGTGRTGFTEENKDVVTRDDNDNITSVGLTGGQVATGLSQAEFRKLLERRAGKAAPIPGTLEATGVKAQRRQEASFGDFQRQTGADELRAGLQEQVENPLDLEPESLAEQGAAIVLKPFEIVGNIIRHAIGKEPLMAEDVAKTKFGKTLAAGAVVVGAIAAAPVVMGLLTKAAAATTISSAVATNAFTLKGAAVSYGTFKAVGGFWDYNRGEFSTLKSEISRASSSSSTILSATLTGQDAVTSIEQLEELAGAVDFAEQRIKDMANTNIKFRLSDEYKEIMALIKDSRLNLIERIGGVSNIARTGVSNLSPEELMFYAMSMEREDDN